MKRNYLKLFASLMFLLFLSSPNAASAYFVTLEEFTGDDAEVLLQITGDGTSSITIAATVLNPTEADLSGIFFNFNQFPGHLGDITVSGSDVTDFLFHDDVVVDLGGGVVITPEGPFDAGIKIGSNGDDDIKYTVFTLTSSYPEILTLGDYFGARIKSTDGPDGSSKLVGNYDPVPEPATMLLFGAGIVGLAGIARRKRD